MVKEHVLYCCQQRHLLLKSSCLKKNRKNKEKVKTRKVDWREVVVEFLLSVTTNIINIVDVLFDSLGKELCTEQQV